MQQGPADHEGADSATTPAPAGNGAVTSTDASYISVKSLWEVFGKDADRIFDAEKSGQHP